MQPCKGVTIHDMGHKMGCNGVDNGQLSFEQYAVPREALLNAFSEVTADGSFSSSIPKARDRFLKVRDTMCSLSFMQFDAVASRMQSVTHLTFLVPCCCLGISVVPSVTLLAGGRPAALGRICIASMVQSVKHLTIL
jgi:hypothetical protein